MARRKKQPGNAPEFVNRKARHQYEITDTLEVGIVLVGTEVKSVREGRVSLGEGYVRVTDHPLSLWLHGVHIGEYAPAGPSRQHRSTAVRQLLAHKREIRKLFTKSIIKGVTVVPLKMYFNQDGRVKVLIGLGTGKKSHDKRQDLRKREADRDIERAMRRRD
ncbi:MAG: SsrA-binding protein SmpB [Phycisphaerales bacterium]|nr:SsrA-binding protein SmpB [Phycisphaerales bacterium]